MIEDQRKRMEKAVADMIQEMYETHFRKMQSEMHLCAVNCCDDFKRRPSLDSVQNCIEDCAVPLLKAQDLVQHELGQFQSKLQNCIMQCNDNVRSNIPLNTHESDISKYRYQVERCTVKCVDKYIGLIPNMMRTIQTVLENGPNDLKQA
ncbi:protein FAM136A-like [Cochliomyia hominivorax]